MGWIFFMVKIYFWAQRTDSFKVAKSVENNTWICYSIYHLQCLEKVTGKATDQHHWEFFSQKYRVNLIPWYRFKFYFPFLVWGKNLLINLCSTLTPIKVELVNHSSTLDPVLWVQKHRALNNQDSDTYDIPWYCQLLIPSF